jgi:hypothetical protein
MIFHAVSKLQNCMMHILCRALWDLNLKEYALSVHVLWIIKWRLSIYILLHTFLKSYIFMRHTSVYQKTFCSCRVSVTDFATFELLCLVVGPSKGDWFLKFWSLVLNFVTSYLLCGTGCFVESLTVTLPVNKVFVCMEPYSQKSAIGVAILN